MRYLKLLYRNIFYDNLSIQEKRDLYIFLDNIKIELYFYFIVVILLLLVKFYA